MDLIMNNKVYKLGKNTKDIIWNIYVNNICEWFIFHPAVRRYMLRAGGKDRRSYQNLSS